MDELMIAIGYGFMSGYCVLLLVWLKHCINGRKLPKNKQVFRASVVVGIVVMLFTYMLMVSARVKEPTNTYWQV